MPDHDQGAGAGRTIIRGNGEHVVLSTLENNTGHLTLEGVTVTGGHGIEGGALDVGSYGAEVVVRDAADSLG